MQSETESGVKYKSIIKLAAAALTYTIEARMKLSHIIHRFNSYTTSKVTEIRNFYVLYLKFIDKSSPTQ